MPQDTAWPFWLAGLAIGAFVPILALTTGKVLGVSGPRGVREMRMMEMEGWTPPFTGGKAEDIVTHAEEIFFSEEDIKKSARRFR